jgi:hypothetical protein
MTTSSYQLTNATIPILPKDLSGGAIAGIVIGAIAGVIVLLLLGYIIYKYRNRLADMLQKDSKQSNHRSIHVC